MRRKEREKSLALNYFQSDLVVKGVEETKRISLIERFHFEKDFDRSVLYEFLLLFSLVVILFAKTIGENWLCSFKAVVWGNFYSRNVGRAARLRRISVSARMMSKDVSARRVSPVITRVKFEEQSIRGERRKSYESAII